jgi:glutamyl-tRNA reductase
VLLIGAGETIKLVAQHLCEKQINRITVANRTLARAQEWVEGFSADAILLSDIPSFLHHADIVISSTASQLPILCKGTVEEALKRRSYKPVLMVDIAVPRDIEAQVDQLESVHLYSVDDLEQVVQDNIQARQNAASLAEDIVSEEVENWFAKQRKLAVVDTIRAFRDSAETIRDAEVRKALSALEKGQDPVEVIHSLARSLTNKLLHKPTTRLKEVSEKEREETINVTHQLFDLNRKKQ